MLGRNPKPKVKTQPAWALGGLVAGLLVGLVVTHLVNQDMENQGHVLSGPGTAAVVGLVMLFCLAIASAASRSRQSVAAPRGETAAAVAAPVVRDPSPSARACPHCNGPMARDAVSCPHCGGASAAWTLSQGVWWTQANDSWYWLDEAAQAWQRWETPGGASPR